MQLTFRFQRSGTRVPINGILTALPEPAATAFAVAAFMPLRHGEIQGLLGENYSEGEMCVSRSIWNGRVTEPKTRKGRAPVQVIRQRTW